MLINHKIESKVPDHFPNEVELYNERRGYKDITRKQADLIDLKELGDKNEKLNNKQEKEKELHQNYIVSF